MIKTFFDTNDQLPHLSHNPGKNQPQISKVYMAPPVFNSKNNFNDPSIRFQK